VNKEIFAFGFLLLQGFEFSTRINSLKNKKTQTFSLEIAEPCAFLDFFVAGSVDEAPGVGIPSVRSVTGLVST